MARDRSAVHYTWWAFAEAVLLAACGRDTGLTRAAVIAERGRARACMHLQSVRMLLQSSGNSGTARRQAAAHHQSSGNSGAAMRQSEAGACASCTWGPAWGFLALEVFGSRPSRVWHARQAQRRRSGNYLLLFLMP
eukprot:3976918-Alexandrium_andersonii.AAC.1